jgi:hypothetical protein
LIPSHLRPVLASAAVYAAATAAMGKDLLASPGSVIGADIGDPMLNAAILAWNARTVPWTDTWFNFPAFHPATDALTFSEHLLGVSVLASPVYWMTGNAVVTYNVTLLLGYVLSGLAMFVLVRRLTGSAPAAFLAGAAFAFAPYRAAQLPHIQVGIVLWAPLALLGLHAYLETGGRRWLVLFGVCWMLQGAANGYFLIFFSVLVGLWVLWFVIVPRRWRALRSIAVALALAALPLAPILARYVSAHSHYGLFRPHSEIVGFSADISAVLCASSHLAVWGWLQAACRPEGELFPGLTMAVLCGVGLCLASWRRIGARHWQDTLRARSGRLVAGALLTAAALWIVSAASWDLGPLRASSSSVVKPLWRGLALLAIAGVGWKSLPAARRRGWAHSTVRSLGIVLWLVFGVAAAFMLSALSVAVAGPWQWSAEPMQIRAALSALSLLVALAALALVCHGSASAPELRRVRGFYVVAAVVTWVLALGPSPSLAGEPVLPQGPYAWLMLLPGVDGLRVPARFWMMATICLSVVVGFIAAVLFQRQGSRVSTVLASLGALAFMADGWAAIPAAPLLPAPPKADLLRGGVVLTLPLGSNRDIDIAAQFAAVTGGWVSINGFSGYEPVHYDRLRLGSRNGDPVIFSPFRARGDLHVIVAENAGPLRRLVEEQPETVVVAENERWRQYRMARRGRLPPQEPSGNNVAIASVSGSCSDQMLPLVIDRDYGTRWECGPQRPAQEIIVDLARTATVGTVVPALGRFSTDYPRHLRVETSIDGASWQTAWDGGVVAEAIEAEFVDPATNRLVVAFAPRPARYVRLRLMSGDDVWYWSIAELEVWSGSTP